jgi:hypothetical protein
MKLKYGMQVDTVKKGTSNLPCWTAFSLRSQRLCGENWMGRQFGLINASCHLQKKEEIRLFWTAEAQRARNFS